MIRLPRPILYALSVTALITSVLDCTPPEVPKPSRDPRTQKWLDRARSSYRVVDIDDASDAIEEALRAAPDDLEVRMVASQVALAKLDYAKTIKLSEGVQTSEAYAIRGRAYWYQGDVEGAGRELHLLLRDPDIHDNWAKSVLQLINRGSGRKPFTVTGNIVAMTEMPRIRGTAMVIPIEVDGEQGLGMLSTSTAEVVLDSSQRREPSWVSIRIAGRVEFHDVPALTQDLSGVARQLGIPSIKALLGVNFLRHANVTFDFLAQQFVVRRFDPPRPPNATDVPLAYIRGGGMTLRSTLKAENGQTAALMIDTSMSFPIALDPAGWKKAGVDVATLREVPGEPKLKQGVVPVVRLGSFDEPQIPGVSGVDLTSIEDTLGIDLDGVLGSGLLAGFRITLGDSGRMMWVEEEMISTGPAAGPQPQPGGQGPDGAVMPPPPPPPSSTAPPLQPAPTAPRNNGPKGPR
ncbi:MAG: hypothetical protein HY898_20370 [Deltaproteobacteria bacterium]|nr:hypothetical protein [Deltaproteobacteria bacterium]